MLKTLYRGIDVISEYAAMACLVAMTLFVLIQVFFRYILNNALPWPEEFSRFLFIWATFLSFSIAMKEGSHLRVEVLLLTLSQAGQRWLNLGCMLINAVFFLWVSVLGCDMTLKVHALSQKAVSLPFPIWIVWLGIPLGCFLTFLQTLKWLVILVKPELVDTPTRGEHV